MYPSDVAADTKRTLGSLSNSLADRPKLPMLTQHFDNYAEHLNRLEMQVDMLNAFCERLTGTIPPYDPMPPMTAPATQVQGRGPTPPEIMEGLRLRGNHLTDRLRALNNHLSDFS